MHVEQVMKPPKCCREGESVQDCARMMKEQNIGFVPVCNQGGEPIGALTDRDLAIRVLAERRPAQTKVEEVMTRDIISCRVGDDLDRAEQLMREHHKARMMVCDQSGKLAGVISLSDIADLETDEAASQTFREVASRETQQPHAS